MKKTLKDISEKIRVALNRAIELSSVEFFDDDSQNETDKLWNTFVY